MNGASPGSTTRRPRRLSVAGAAVGPIGVASGVMDMTGARGALILVLSGALVVIVGWILAGRPRPWMRGIGDAPAGGSHGFEFGPDRAQAPRQDGPSGSIGRRSIERARAGRVRSPSWMHDLFNDEATARYPTADSAGGAVAMPASGSRVTGTDGGLGDPVPSRMAEPADHRPVPERARATLNLDREPDPVDSLTEAVSASKTITATVEGRMTRVVDDSTAGDAVAAVAAVAGAGAERVEIGGRLPDPPEDPIDPRRTVAVIRADQQRIKAALESLERG